MFDRKKYMKKWRQDNLGECKRKRGESYLKNKEQENLQCKEWYSKHKKERKRYNAQYRQQNKETLSVERRDRGILWTIYARFFWGDKCSRCGGDYILQFYHSIPKTKLFQISAGCYYAPPEAFITELNKCVLLCQSCHLKITGKIKNEE